MADDTLDHQPLPIDSVFDVNDAVSPQILIRRRVVFVQTLHHCTLASTLLSREEQTSYDRYLSTMTHRGHDRWGLWLLVIEQTLSCIDVPLRT